MHCCSVCIIELCIAYCLLLIYVIFEFFNVIVLFVITVNKTCFV